MSERTNATPLGGNRGFQDVREAAYRAVFFSCAAVSVLTTIGIVLALIVPTITFIGEVGVGGGVVGVTHG